MKDWTWKKGPSVLIGAVLLVHWIDKTLGMWPCLLIGSAVTVIVCFRLRRP